MEIFRNIGKLLFDTNIHFIIKKYNQTFLINLFSTVAIGLLAIYGVDEYFTTQDMFLVFLDIALIALMLTNLLLLNINKLKPNPSGVFFTLLITIYLLIAFGFGYVDEKDILWYAAYPIITLLLFPKKGKVFASLFIIILIVGLFLPVHATYTTNFSITTKVIFLVAYLGSFILVELLKQSITGVIENQEQEFARLHDELKEKEEFISKVSHQIRTPLNNIVVVSNMINPSKLEEKHKDYFDTILASTNNIVDVVNSFSEITNVDVQERRKYEIKFDLYNTLQNTINLFSDKEETSEKFSIDIKSDINYPLIGDPVKIKQVFLNLIEQILKNSEREKSDIQIFLREEEKFNEKVKISFELNAEGINLDNIKAKSSSRKEQITQSLEINIARRTINSLGGELETSISDGKLFFRFELDFKPAKEEEKEAQMQQGEMQTREMEGKVDLKDANVLLVEDNLINQKIVLLSLKKAVKNVDVANNGKEALDKFGSVKYDIILMDIQMPVMNGIITTKKIRNIEKSTNTHTPIIAITANALLGDKEECLAAGTDDYISKPFQIETLLNKMDTLLSGKN